MTHDQVVAEIQARAKLRGLVSHYCRRSQRCTGDQGMPDIIIVGRDGVVWLEVKTPQTPDPGPEQIRWKYKLQAAGQVCEIMTETDLEPGMAVDAILEFAATGDVR